jgi:hypothetical protein
MFDVFNRRSNKDTDKMIKKIASPEFTPDEVFRVGSTRYGETTLTLMTPDGMSMTATMNQTTCERLIRMLRATYNVEDFVEEGRDDA